jgi:hypothetical protein
MGQTETRVVQSDTRVPKSPTKWDEVGLGMTERAAVSALLNRHTSMSGDDLTDDWALGGENVNASARASYGHSVHPRPLMFKKSCRHRHFYA